MLGRRADSCRLPKYCNQDTKSASPASNDAESYVTPGQAAEVGKNEERSVKRRYRNGGWEREQIQLPQHNRVHNRVSVSSRLCLGGSAHSCGLANVY